MKRLITIAAVVAATTAACGSPPPAETVRREPVQERETTSVLSTHPRTAAAGDDAVPLLAVGDIASCTTVTDELVAAIAARRAGTIVIPGDAVYEKGTAREYRECFHPAWGPLYDRIRPAVGNHDYGTAGAGGFFGYFDERVRRPGRGWYAFDIGEHWRGIVLNSNCTKVGCSRTSRQGQWLARALGAARGRHVVAVTHHPRFSTGEHGSTPSMRPFFRMLYRAGVPLLLSGHDHTYERFAPQNAAGERRRHGVRQFVVGTGGRGLYEFSHALPATQVRNNTAHGVLRLRLRPDGYDWRFIAADDPFSDSGSKSLPRK